MRRKLVPSSPSSCAPSRSRSARRARSPSANRCEPASVGRPRRALRRDGCADPALQRLAPLPTTFLTADTARARSRDRRAARPRSHGSGSPIARSPFDPAYHGGSCFVGGPYTGYPCASQNATGIPVPASQTGAASSTLPQTSDVGIVRITSVLRAAVRATARSRPWARRMRSAAKRGSLPPLTIVGYGAQAGAAGRPSRCSSACSASVDPDGQEARTSRASGTSSSRATRKSKAKGQVSRRRALATRAGRCSPTRAAARRSSA